MAPKFVLKKNRSSNIVTKKLNHSLMAIAKLRKQNELLSNQNKELSIFRNNILLHKLELENEIKSVRNSNVQLTVMHSTVCKKLRLVEQNVQECVPALVTLSACIPNILQSVHELCKVEKFNEMSQEKKKIQTKSVSPMINGIPIIQPAVSLRRLDMSTINESPEQTPKRPRYSNSRRSSPHSNLEPYVRLKDVKVMLRNFKTVPSESTYHQLEGNFGEGPSWLHSQENQMHNSDNSNSHQDNSATDSFETSTPVLNNETTPTISASAVSSSKSMTNITLNESDLRNREIMYPDESSILKNITTRKRPNRRSSETSVISDIDDSTASMRSRRSGAKKVNYKEPKLGSKLRRN